MNYLLEQSRIVSQNPGERNYHIFYQLIQCGSMQEHPLAKWNLGQPQDYMVLSRGGTYVYIFFITCVLAFLFV